MLDIILRKLDKMLGNFNDEMFDTFIRHVERLGAVGIVFAGSIGLLLHANRLPGGPWLGRVIGGLALIGTFFLIVLVGVGAWKAARAALSKPWLGHFVGVSVFVVAVFIAIGGMNLAFGEAQQDAPADQQTAARLAVG
ncbi:hypothetical protein [Thioalkalivibrio denitrificans]|uniref:hypothetical protein n=1 Tax=Thioalkalivibrio denitrificans TaxID=108003 RepID=UPI000985150F|nr:hypothetical protein [Thioalkalivibrio denitrificans]